MTKKKKIAHVTHDTDETVRDRIEPLTWEGPRDGFHLLLSSLNKHFL